jgi:hypothetical protein
MVKQKRKEKAGKWEVPLPAVKAQSEAEVFKILKSGQSRYDEINFCRLSQAGCGSGPVKSDNFPF